MSNKIRTAALLVSAMAAMAFSGTAFAQDAAAAAKMSAETGKETTKTVAENDKLKVGESYFAPGAVAKMGVRDGLLSIHLSPMTAERTFEDGTKQVIHFKAGQAELISEKRPFSSKNIGKNTAHLLAIHLKN